MNWRISGAKVWRYWGKTSIVTLDEYPSMSLQAARAERDRLRSPLRGGANPAQVARVEKAGQGEWAANTFGAIGLELLAKRTTVQSMSRMGAWLVSWRIDTSRFRASTSTRGNPHAGAEGRSSPLARADHGSASIRAAPCHQCCSARRRCRPAAGSHRPAPGSSGT
ncbi:Arm DNA-binding domain-containing protein [Stenotrophomonas maltophilia]|uniref:Arm DNA-binding domain-containing protein n=1 Tax=Stenotrophomonas maltophilia TaxID=40324 RepID=UPI0020C167D0|nr:Arm DNA-binding domain-containing protein [Stenotrophomonas maltophilia]